LAKRVALRNTTWFVEDEVCLGDRISFKLRDVITGEDIEVLCPPDEFSRLSEPAPSLDKRSLTPYAVWQSQHAALQVQTPPEGRYAAFVSGRISPLSPTSSPRSLDS